MNINDAEIVPEGHLTIIRQFYWREWPERQRRPVGTPDPSALMSHFNRADGTTQNPKSQPGVETPGYSRPPLRGS